MPRMNQDRLDFLRHHEAGEYADEDAISELADEVEECLAELSLTRQALAQARNTIHQERIKYGKTRWEDRH